jgi:hypothetical protein
MRMLKSLCCALLMVGSVSSVFAAGEISEVTGQGKVAALQAKAARTDRFKISVLPEELKGLPSIFVPRGDYNKPGSGFSFKLAKPATIYIFVDQRDKGQELTGWEKTALTATWKADRDYKDHVYKKDFPAGLVEIPKNSIHAIPNLAVVATK